MTPIFVFAMAGSLAIQAIDEPEVSTGPDHTRQSTGVEQDNDANRDNNYFSNWGVGPAITYDVFNRPRVDNARVENGIIRGDEQANAGASLLLEMHFMRPVERLTPFSRQFGSSFCGDGILCGAGPFIAVQAGSDEIIEALGAGWMWGFRREDQQDRLWGAGQFNFGVGLVVDPNATTLAPGFELNEPLPAGATDVIVEDDAQVGLIIVFSLSR